MRKIIKTRIPPTYTITWTAAKKSAQSIIYNPAMRNNAKNKQTAECTKFLDVQTPTQDKKRSDEII